MIAVDAQAIPMIHTVDASTLISDSGITRCRVEAKVWDIYSNNGDKYQHFPEGIYVERFDSLFQVEGSIKADTAYFFERKELWQAIGNVVVKNAEGTVFETSELFWDERVPPGVVNAFYTHRLVKITYPNGTVSYGINGFKADRSLNNPRLFDYSADLIIEEESPDSIQQKTVNRNNEPLLQ